MCAHAALTAHLHWTPDVNTPRAGAEVTASFDLFVETEMFM